MFKPRVIPGTGHQRQRIQDDPVHGPVHEVYAQNTRNPFYIFLFSPASRIEVRATALNDRGLSVANYSAQPYEYYGEHHPLVNMLDRPKELFDGWVYVGNLERTRTTLVPERLEELLAFTVHRELWKRSVRENIVHLMPYTRSLHSLAKAEGMRYALLSDQLLNEKPFGMRKSWYLKTFTAQLSPQEPERIALYPYLR